MERTNIPTKKLQTLSELVTRANLASKLGIQSYGGDRDLYMALGYPLNITYEEYESRYERQDIAKAVIDRPVSATWQGSLKLVETPDSSITPLEEAWKVLSGSLKLKNQFAKLDRLSGIGRYGVLLLGINDAPTLEGFANPVVSGARKLLYVKAFGENAAKILSYVSKPNNPRYEWA